MEYIDGKRYIGIHYEATGVSGCSYRADGIEVVNIGSNFVPNPDIHINGYGEKLIHPAFDHQMTIVPGVRRNIEREDGSIDGYFQFYMDNIYYLFVSDARFTVKTFNSEWAVYGESEMAARIVRIAEGERSRFEEDGYDMEERFYADIADRVDDKAKLYIMAIPVLGF